MDHENALSAPLEAFEVCLEAPIVPGELSSWVENAQQTCNEAVALYLKRLAAHQRMFAENREQGPESSTQVEQFRDRDTKLEQRASQLKHAADLLSDKAEAFESEDPVVDRPVEKFIDVGVAWIIDVRKQEAEISSWQESLHHDRRGVN